MINTEFNKCPGTLAPRYSRYSRTCIKRVFNGRQVNHILPYASVQSNPNSDDSFEKNAIRMSISGVQEKFSLIQLKNKVRLTKEGEQGTHILKPIPSVSKNADQMPARMGQGKIVKQFRLLADYAGIPEKQTNAIMALMVSKSDQVKKLIDASFLKGRIQRNYFQYDEYSDICF